MNKIYEAYQRIINEKRLKLYTWAQINNELGIKKTDQPIPDEAYPQGELGLSTKETKAIIKFIKSIKKHTIEIDDSDSSNIKFTLNSLEDSRILISATM